MRSSAFLAAMAFGGSLALADSDGSSTITSAAAIQTGDQCEAVYESCVQRGITSTNAYGMTIGPNFAACGASSDACERTKSQMTTPASITSSPSSSAATTGPCESVYYSCVSVAITSTNSYGMTPGPNFAYCGALSQSCVGDMSKTMAPSAAVALPSSGMASSKASSSYASMSAPSSTNPAVYTGAADSNSGKAGAVAAAAAAAAALLI